MKIAMFSAEMVPYAKTGGLADVVGVLPSILRSTENQIDVYLPYHGIMNLNKDKLIDVKLSFPITCGDVTRTANIFEYDTGDSKTRVFLIDNYHLFGSRKELYVEHGKDYGDNGERFIFYSKAALKAIEELHLSYDIFHAHDWHAGVIPLLTRANDYQFEKPRRIIFTIHNFAYQGSYHGKDTTFRLLNLPDTYWSMHVLEYFGSMNFMKAAITQSDIVTTVSPTYAAEIQTSAFGCGLDGLIRQYSFKLHGILNGVDYSTWNPETDKEIAKNYSITDLSGKKECKIALQHHFHLTEDPSIPIMGIISRLDWQKGVALFPETMYNILPYENVQFVFLGSGAPEWEVFFRQLAQDFPHKVGVTIGYNNKLAHMIEAGADIYLMPSMYEPCGLNQMYSLKYGTIPIVRETGGLADTVFDYSRNPQIATGFSFRDFVAYAFIDAIDRAINLYLKEPVKWRQLMQYCMKQDHSWEQSAKKYLQIYKK